MQKGELNLQREAVCTGLGEAGFSEWYVQNCDNSGVTLRLLNRSYSQANKGQCAISGN